MLSSLSVGSYCISLMTLLRVSRRTIALLLTIALFRSSVFYKTIQRKNATQGDVFSLVSQVSERWNTLLVDIESLVMKLDYLGFRV